MAAYLSTQLVEVECVVATSDSEAKRDLQLLSTRAGSSGQLRCRITRKLDAADSAVPGQQADDVEGRPLAASSTAEEQLAVDEYEGRIESQGGKKKAPKVKCMCPDDVLSRPPSQISLLWEEEGSSGMKGAADSGKTTKELACTAVRPAAGGDSCDNCGGEVSASSIVKNLSWIDRYLFVWILAVMVIGVLVGNFVPEIQDAWDGVKIDNVSLPIAIGLWWMMFPVLCKVRYEMMGKLLTTKGLLFHICFSLILNWILAPLLMTGLAWATLPDLPGYRNGVILVGIARCIAMVLIWNHLAGGNSEFCAILVAVNSVLQIVLYSPFAIFYLDIISGGASIDVSFWTVAKSVLLFLGVPLVAAVITRFTLRGIFGAQWYDKKFMPWFGPLALLGLLFTIFVMFSLQGEEIIHNIGEVARVAVPLLLYFTITFLSSMLICYYLKFPYADTVTQCFTTSSNNFELAIAVAIGSFGIKSEEALAAVIGPLIEVPVLIGLVYVSLWVQKRLKWSSEGAMFVDEDEVEKDEVEK